MTRTPTATPAEPAKGTIRLLPDPAGGPADKSSPVRTVQAAELDLPESFLEEIWRPEYLERIARAYWAYLERVFLHLIRVVYEPNARTVVFLSKRIPLLRFRRPSYQVATGMGMVTWGIERGFLVSPRGRGRGQLRITIRRLDDHDAGEGMSRVRIDAEVANFYPGLRLGGPLARLTAWFYNQTQMRIHVIVTHGFLRSLAALELPQSKVGALLDGGDDAPLLPPGAAEEAQANAGNSPG